MSKYSEKLKDPRWQKLRLKILERDSWACCGCGEDKLMLLVHHLYYQKGKDPWEYQEDDLLTLCEDCHNYEYEMRKDLEDDFLLMLKQRGFLYNDLFLIANCINRLERWEIIRRLNK